MTNETTDTTKVVPEQSYPTPFFAKFLEPGQKIDEDLETDSEEAPLGE